MELRQVSSCLVVVVLLLLGTTSVMTQPYVRLADGPSPSEGRVEVYNGLQWGTVCNDGFDSVDGEAVCRQLGYGRGPPNVSINTYPKLSGPIHKSQVQCSAGHRYFSSCTSAGWGVHNCTHSQDVNLQCPARDFMVDLRYFSEESSDGTTLDGYPTVTIARDLGAVCRDNINDADLVSDVICRDYGYESGQVSPYYDSYSPSSALLTNVTCRGTEAHLRQCSSVSHLGLRCSSRSNYLAVRCQRPRMAPPVPKGRYIEFIGMGVGLLMVIIISVVSFALIRNASKKHAAQTSGIATLTRADPTRGAPGYPACSAAHVDDVAVHLNTIRGTVAYSNPAGLPSYPPQPDPPPYGRPTQTPSRCAPHVVDAAPTEQSTRGDLDDDTHPK